MPLEKDHFFSLGPFDLAYNNIPVPDQVTEEQGSRRQVLQGERAGELSKCLKRVSYEIKILTEEYYAVWFIVNAFYFCVLFPYFACSRPEGQRGNIGLGTMGGGTQMLFGGSGGQDLFQKITWALGALFMGGSLALRSYEVINLA